MKNILKVTFVIIGTIIGAGFASGQEIYLFFNQYGNLGILGILLACSFTGMIIYKVFVIIKKENIDDYPLFLEKINKNKKINQIIQIIIQIFLLISFYIMIAGMSAYFKQEFGIPTWLCSIITSTLCYITLQQDIKGVMWVNNLLIPCLILFILYLGFKNLGINTEYKNIKIITNTKFSNWLVSSVLYASYNSIILIPMLIELKQYLSSNKKVKKTSILCTIILSLLGICLFFLLKIDSIEGLELPMLQVVKKFGDIYPHLYGGVIVVAIFTSAISAGYGFLKNYMAKKIYNYEQERKKYRRILLIICIGAPIVANFGFSNLVNNLYPIFGLLGLLQIYAIFKQRVIG